MALRSTITRLSALIAVLVCARSFSAPTEETIAPELARRTSLEGRLSDAKSPTSGMEILPQASIVTPFSLVLTNSHFQVPYSDSMAGGVPSFSLGLASPLMTLGQFEISWLARAGYGQTQGQFSAKSPDGVSSSQKITLSWMPVSGGARLLYEIPGLPSVNPTLIAGGGTFWILQRSSTEDLNSNFLVPFVFLSPGLTLFEGRAVDDWFGGLSFGTSFFRSLSSSQAVHGVSFDMSVSILL